MISKRPCVRVCTLFFLLSLVGCDGSSGGGNDAGTDAGNDAGTDASTVDSGRDSGTPAQGPGNACNGPADCQTEGETVGISCIGGHCGCATNAKLGAIPQSFTWFRKRSDMYCVPLSMRKVSPRPASVMAVKCPQRRHRSPGTIPPAGSN